MPLTKEQKEWNEQIKSGKRVYNPNGNYVMGYERPFIDVDELEKQMDEIRKDPTKHPMYSLQVQGKWAFNPYLQPDLYRQSNY